MKGQRLRLYGFAAIGVAVCILLVGAYLGTGESRESRVEHAIAGGALDGPGFGPAKPPPGVRAGQPTLPNMPGGPRAPANR